jgi:hypothetical protein
MARDFEEWIRITSAPRRAAPLIAIMRSLAKAGIHADMDIGLSGQIVLSRHRWRLIAAAKNRQA